MEAMAALVVMDALLAQEARQSARSKLPLLKRKAVIPADETVVEDRATKRERLENINGH